MGDKAGVLEMKLIEARGLKDKDFAVRMNTYVVIEYGKQKHTSRIAKGGGTKPMWNEAFKFEAECPGGEDHKIYVKNLIASGMDTGKAELHGAKYAGEISVDLCFSMKR